MESGSGFSKLLKFIRHLSEMKTSFDLKSIRDDTICVRVYVPGQHWEVEFYENGDIEIEIYQSDGNIFDEKALERLWPMTE